MTARDITACDEGAIERLSAAWFREQSYRLGCDNWRGPERLRLAADEIESLLATIARLERRGADDLEALTFIRDRVLVTRGPMGSFYRTDSSPEDLYQVGAVARSRLQALSIGEDK